mgnify:CR=1 FL=1
MARGIERSIQSRSKLRSFLIVTNGAVTERSYLSALKSRMYNLESMRKSVRMRIEVIESDPMTLLRKVTAPQANNSDYDEIWIVVDHDGTDRTEFLRRCAKKSTKKQKVIGVVSIPCFEVWLVAHYEQIRNYQNQKEAQRHYLQLARLEQDKQKSLPENFPWDGIDAACERSRLKGVKLPDVNAQGPCPSTTMPHLISALGLHNT